MADASGVGMTIDADELPIEAGARALFAAHGEDAVVEALRGGDDYELLIAVRPRTERRLDGGEAAWRRVIDADRRCTAERGIRLRGATGAPLAAGALPRGYVHFR